MTIMKVHEAEQQVEDEKWKCETCDRPALEEGKYCLNCKMYWDDVANGLFSE